MLKAVENDSWTSRYNFFLLLRALVVAGNQPVLFQVFNRVLVESLLKVEDEVMIVVTEIISSLLPLYFSHADQSQISQLVANLQQNLKQSDEIDSSSISVFQLLSQIMDSSLLQQAGLNLHLDLEVICPFNFHKVVNVRQSYNRIVGKSLSRNIQYAK